MSEEKEPIRNGIDVSESVSSATNNNIVYSQKVVDELQNDIKRLQKENKRLQMLSCANCGEKYLSPDGAELYEKNVQLQEENEKLKETAEGLLKIQYALADSCNKYRKALEEIREIAKSAKKDICNNCGWRNTDSCEPEEYTCGEFAKIQDKINEALNDRD